MRIKPWVLTGAVMIAASVAAGVIVTANDPSTSTALLRGLFWAALALSVWGLFATVLLAVRLNLAQATWLGFTFAVGLFGCLLFWRAGYHDRRLLGGLIFATLLVSLPLWWRLRDAR